MTWTEIDNEFDLAPIWLDYMVEHLCLNANIELESKKNRRNFLNDPYFENYNRFTPVCPHKYRSLTDFVNTKINCSKSSCYPLWKHWNDNHNIIELKPFGQRLTE